MRAFFKRLFASVIAARQEQALVRVARMLQDTEYRGYPLYEVVDILREKSRGQ